LLKYSAGQLNTLVNFESVLLGLDGQFSVGGNIHGSMMLEGLTSGTQERDFCRVSLIVESRMIVRPFYKQMRM
jgi:hypothetical protein